MFYTKSFHMFVNHVCKYMRISLYIKFCIKNVVHFRIIHIVLEKIELC